MLVKLEKEMSTLIIRDAKEDELAFIREMRLHAYEEHAPKIPETTGMLLKKSIIIGCGFKTWY